MTKIFENIFAIIACAICFVAVILLGRKHFIDCLDITGKEAVTEMLSEVAVSGELSKNVYEICTGALYLSGYDGECKVTVFTEEYSVDGTKHLYMVSWEEISREIFEKGVYKCPENSFVKVTIGKTFGKGNWMRKLLGEAGEWTKCIYVSEGAMGI